MKIRPSPSGWPSSWPFRWLSWWLVTLEVIGDPRGDARIFISSILLSFDETFEKSTKIGNLNAIRYILFFIFEYSSKDWDFFIEMVVLVLFGVQV